MSDQLDRISRIVGTDGNRPGANLRPAELANRRSPTFGRRLRFPPIGFGRLLPPVFLIGARARKSAFPIISAHPPTPRPRPPRIVIVEGIYIAATLMIQMVSISHMAFYLNLQRRSDGRSLAWESVRRKLGGILNGSPRRQLRMGGRRR